MVGLRATYGENQFLRGFSDVQSRRISWQRQQTREALLATGGLTLISGRLAEFALVLGMSLAMPLLKLQEPPSQQR